MGGGGLFHETKVFVEANLRAVLEWTSLRHNLHSCRGLISPHIPINSYVMGISITAERTMLVHKMLLEVSLY